jgi:2,3,4,5-tetrahydropyridine-2-carboxylate N-succinyltransferase
MSPDAMKKTVEAAWDARDTINASTKGEFRTAVDAALSALDNGSARVAEKKGGEWVTHEWLKKAVLLSFRLNDNWNHVVARDTGHTIGWDKVPLKFADWGEKEFKAAGFRAVPGAIVRRGSFVASNVVLMPSFVNIGAYVDSGTMVDTWATDGSCAQIGRNCHISGGAGIGGVLEPLQASPVVIEDNCFIGARSEVAEGVIVGEGSVLSMGVYLGASTRIIDRASGKVTTGRVPPYSVVVAGSSPGASGGPALYCAVIVKTVDAQTRAKTGINELLRD